MKIYPTIITMALMATCVASTFGQGTVVFNNGTGLVWQQKTPSDPTLIPVPKGGGMVQLYWAPAGSAYVPWSGSMSGSAWQFLNPLWKMENPIGFTTPTAGKFNGGALTLTPLAAGGTIDYVVIGWTGNAQSFDEALASASYITGVSSVFTSATGNPLTTPPGTPIPLADSFGGMAIVVTAPEPSCSELVVLGAATLLALRRRK